MQIFDFELFDETVTAPDAAIAPGLAPARAVGREHRLEQDALVFARPLSLAIPLHCFVSGSGAAAQPRIEIRG